MVDVRRLVRLNTVIGLLHYIFLSSYFLLKVIFLLNNTLLSGDKQWTNGGHKAFSKLKR